MRKLILHLFLPAFLFFIPIVVSAAPYEVWRFETVEEMEPWKGNHIERFVQARKGLKFDVKGKAVLYRELPEGFHEYVQAISIQMDPQDLNSVTLLLLRKSEVVGKIQSSMEIPLEILPDGSVDAYIVLASYREYIEKADTLALRMDGVSQDVILSEVSFLAQSWYENLIGGVRSFFWMQPLAPYSINLIIGPVIVPDIGKVGTPNPHSFAFTTSFNAYLLTGLTLFGVGVLLWGLWIAAHTKVRWRELRRRMFTIFFGMIAVVWLLYDVRMSAEILGGFVHDFRSYVFASSQEKEFRDLEHVHAFTEFVQPYVAERSTYELWLAKRRPYEGMFRYATYPALLNLEEKSSDTFVVYNRKDISFGEDEKLYLENEPISARGVILDRFDEYSFVFREYPSSDAL